MRINRIKLRNYRQFENADISLDRGATDLHLIIGTNGTGKTNLLNAVNWCLYGDEPHLSRESARLPLPNLRSLESVESGQDIIVEVELWLQDESNRPLVFTRASRYRKHQSGDAAAQGVNFEVHVVDEDGNTKIHSGDTAEDYVARTFPREIREYFFFDGERLDRYFREATGQKVKNAVLQISRVDLLDTLERKLTTLKREFTAEAGKSNPQIEAKDREVQNLRAQEAEITRNIDECKKQLEISEQKIEELNAQLQGIPDVEAIEKDRSSLKTSFAAKEATLKEKSAAKGALVIEQARHVMLAPAIDKALSLINEKKARKEIPPTVDKELVASILKAGVCQICNQPLTGDARSHVAKLHDSITLTLTTASRLFETDIHLSRIRSDYEIESKRIRKLGEEIRGLDIELEQINVQLGQLDAKVKGYDEAKIAALYKERGEFESADRVNRERLGDYKGQLQRTQSELADRQKELDNELAKNRKLEGLNRKIEFCTAALNVLGLSTLEIMEETRAKIQNQTTKHFLNLIWKKDTFREVLVEPDYTVELIHAMGYSCLGAVSAGERGLLALAFTLALHDASGFDAPILIDTPVARISDQQRTKFAQVLTKVGVDKQIMLLFTPSEYSEEISAEMDRKSTTRRRISLSGNERTVVMEQL